MMLLYDIDMMRQLRHPLAEAYPNCCERYISEREA